MEHKDFAKLSPFVNLDKLWHSYLTEDRQGKEEIEQILGVLREKIFQEASTPEQIFLKPPAKEVCSGEFLLGDVYYGIHKLYPFGLRPEELCSHIGVFGRSGSGKTSVVMLFIWNLLRYQIPFLLLDWKQEYDALTQLFPKIRVYFVGGSESNFCWNPLIPPEHFTPEQYQDYIKDVATIFTHAYFPNMSVFSLEGMKFFFIETVDKICQSLANHRGTQQYPTFAQILSSLEKPSKPFAYAYNALKSCLQSLCFGATDKIFNAANPTSLSEIFGTSVILEIRTLGSEADKRFFGNMLLYWLYQYRLNQKPTSQVKHVFIMEEAHQHQGELIEQVFRMIRAFGESLVFIDQHPSLLAVPVFGNMYTTIVLNLKHDKDIDVVAKSIGLSTDERNCLGRLAYGQAIVKLQARYSRPFLIHFPKPLVPERIEAKPILPPVAVEEKTALLLSAQEMTFLRHLLEHPELTTSQRYQELSLNPRKGNELQKRLLHGGFIENQMQVTSKGRVNLLKLADKGKAILQEKTTCRHGGALHQYAVARLMERWAKAGYQAVSEFPIGNGKTVDIMLFYGNQKIAVEVETGASDFVNNIEKCRRAGYPLIIVATTSTVDAKIKSWLAARKQELGEQLVKIMRL